MFLAHVLFVLVAFPQENAPTSTANQNWFGIFLNILMMILLSTLACAIGVFASVWLPYPEQKEMLVLAIVLFFSLMLALFLIDIFIMQGATACVRDSQGKPLFIGVGVDTNESSAMISLRREKSRLSRSLPLGKCFDTEGYLLIDNVSATLEILFDDFEKGVTDETKKAGKKRN